MLDSRKPFVQRIVSRATLGVDSILITNPTANSFGAKFSGSITVMQALAKRFDAEISFGSDLTIEWSNKPLGWIKMPNIKITGGKDAGTQFGVEDTFRIADVGHMTNFMEAFLTQESFDLVFSGKNLSVAVPALGIVVPGISLPRKKVTLLGFNNLKDGVLIESFDLPADDRDGGIHLALNATITNRSQVGIVLSSIHFQTYFGDTNIGPIASKGPFKVEPWGTFPLALVGRLVPQTERSGLRGVSTIVNNFTHGLDSDVLVCGDSAAPGDAAWLNEGIKYLRFKTRLRSERKLVVVESIELNELALQFTRGSAYNPATSSNDATVTFKLPFDFPVDIKALGANINVSTGGAPFAELIIPKGPASTVKKRIFRFVFSGVPFAVFDGQHKAFQQFLLSMTTSTKQTIQLSGKANVDAHTAVGLLSLTDIDFFVLTSIAGLQGLSAEPPLVTIPDDHGFSDHLSVEVVLSNPSKITLGAGDVKFDLFFQNHKIGTADLTNLVLLPGDQSYTIDLRFQSDAVSSGQAFKLLENYRRGVTLETMIQGSKDSTTIASLKVALSEIRLTPRSDVRT